MKIRVQKNVRGADKSALSKIPRDPSWKESDFDNFISLHCDENCRYIYIEKESTVARRTGAYHA